MAWRIDRDESNFKSADVIAWEFVLPFMYLPILDEDTKKVETVKKFLLEYFPKDVLEKVAIKILTNRWNKTLKNLKKDIVVKDALYDIQKVVNEQANDDGLWFVAKTAPEAYLQQELRRLHKIIEEYSLDGE